VIIATLAALAIAVAGYLLLADHQPPEQTRAQDFVDAWARGDYAAMHAQLTDAARRRTPLREFTADYKKAAATATATALRPGKAGEPVDGVVTVPVTVSTRVFGPVAGTLRLPFAGEDDAARVNWSTHLTFPGVRRGETLVRHMQMPRRADLLARDGTPLAQGPERASPIADVAS
jgi:hypothetical protein